MNENCVMAAVGKSSLHREWVDENSKFDLHLIIYDDSYGLYKNDTPYVTTDKGYKFKLIYDYLSRNPDLIDRYNYIYMPDDDISIDSSSIKKLFNLMDKYQLASAQPAIANSFYSYPHTTKHKDSILRYTNFIEIMQPCFSQEALKKVLFTFNETKSGWGIDFHWGIILDYTQMNMAIIDDIGSNHTRPVQSDNREELHEYMTKHDLSYDIYST
ncbi:hypothetical protein BUL40_09320 [Croceivirga radicis]|uniref:DUF707 domain-containing protein n=1 Tax=Croceivirga radicis TaxID=1929488 RepID=A0A1V6LR91_9FLAO|nr:DUF707 domain-containing protein [Croceivirga radicis]OQD42711.1 hypothetical protein BUL40_09320 [Croceivirga radicis]